MHRRVSPGQVLCRMPSYRYTSSDIGAILRRLHTRAGMSETLERRISQVAGLLLTGVLGLGLGELLGVTDYLSLPSFLALFFGLGVCMALLQWLAS